MQKQGASLSAAGAIEEEQKVAATPSGEWRQWREQKAEENFSFRLAVAPFSRDIEPNHKLSLNFSLYKKSYY